MTLATYLKSARERQGIGLRELARLIECSAAHVQRIETVDGREVATKRPSADLLKRWTETLGLDLDEALRLAGLMPADIEKWVLAKPGRFKRVREMMRRNK